MQQRTIATTRFLPRKKSSARWPSGFAEQTGVLLVGEVHYAVRVRGRSSDAIAVALQEGLGFVVDPVRTVLRGRLPDQGALLGILARVRLLGLELVEVKRLPQQATDDLDHQPAAEISTSQT